MTEPTSRDDEFEDVLGALARTALAPGPRGVDAVALALTAPSGPAARPGRAAGVEAAIARDADEAWSLAVAFLGDEEAAWQAVVSGFVTLGRAERGDLTVADSLRAVAAASLEVWRLLAKAGAAPEVLGHTLPPELRLAILLRGGLRRRDVGLEGAEPADALVAAFPQPGHPRGDELCRLLARQLLGTLEPDKTDALAALRRDHPTSAALIRERYAELAEVPVHVLPRTDELRDAVRAQLAREAEQRDRVGAVRLRITVTCAFCHDGLSRDQAVFCSGCLAPHHQECFMTHGMCSVHGCGQTQVVKAGAPPRRPPGPLRKVALAGAAVVLAGLGAVGGVAAWRAGLLPGSPSGLEAEDEAPRAVVPTDPAVLREAEARTAAVDAAREEARARVEALRKELRAQRVSVSFEQLPFDECVDALRDLVGWNFVVSGDAQDLVDTEKVTVSLRLADVSCEQALNLVVACNEQLTFRVSEPRLIRIQTRSEEDELQLEVYDIADVISGATRQRGGFQLDADTLVEVLEMTGESGEEARAVEFNSDVLIVRGPPGLHERIRGLLRYLRGERPDVTAGGRPAWIDELERKLEKRVSLDFKGAPLGDVVSQLQELSGVNIYVSPAVDQEQTTVVLRMKDVSLADALKLILEQTRLGSRYQHEALLLLPPEDLRDRCTLRILDARDLGWMDPDALEQAITNATGEDHWDAPATIRWHKDQLIVYQTPAMHEAIDQALAKLRLGHARNLETSRPR